MGDTPLLVLNAHAVARFRSAGFLVLRGVFEPEPLSREMNCAFAEGLSEGPVKVGSGGVRFRYLPMMCARTRASLALIDALAVPARRLLRRAVLPGRAKGTNYFGDSGWHRDSDLDVASIGFVAYLESLDAHSGALRVVPGSHRDPGVEVPAEMALDGSGPHGEVLATEPGDVVVFDEHLLHGSAGGRDRRQWRVDSVADSLDQDEEATLGVYFGRLFSGDFNGGYDADRYRSYGPHWQSLDRPWTTRLRDLGVYEQAEAHEGRRSRKGDAI